MKRLLFLTILFQFMYSTSYAEIINGSFEEGLTGLNIKHGNGELEVYENLGNGIVNPTDGSHFLYLSNGPGNVDSGMYDNIYVYSDGFNIERGISTLSFDFNVLTEQPTPSTFLVDTSAISFGNLNVMYCNTGDDSLSFIVQNEGEPKKYETIEQAFHTFECIITTPNGARYNKQTGWNHVIFDVTEIAGMNVTCRLNFNVYDYDQDDAYDTALLVDNIRLNTSSSVPIPGAVWLLGSGIIGLVGLRQKYRN